MYGSRQHASYTTDRFATSPQIAHASAPIIQASRGDSQRLSVVVSEPLSHHISIPDTTYFLPLATLDLSIILFNKFWRAGITTIGQILELDLEAFEHLNFGEKSIQEVIQRVQALDILEPVQGLAEEPLPSETRCETATDSVSQQRERLATTSEHERVDNALCPIQVVRNADRHDRRQRPGRGRRRTEVPHHKELRISDNARFGFCYKVPVAQLPFALRMVLPRWARCGIEQSEENKTSLEELPRRTRYCYVHPFAIGETGDLVEWRPSPAGDVPSHYRVAATPDALRGASCIEVNAQEAQALTRELANAATPSPLIRVAPACFLTEEMRAMIAPGVAFPDAFVVPENVSYRRVSHTQGKQVPVPQQVAGMRIESLSLSKKTHFSLRLAGVTTVGTLLELEEERLGTILDRESLWELFMAVYAKGVLPTPTGLLPVEHAEKRSSPMPMYETFYFYPTGTTYDDPERGQLYLVHAALFVDRLEGSRNGPVETMWLTHAQIGQSLLWHRDLAHLDSLELQARVTRHAAARGATLPSCEEAEDQCQEHTRQMLEMEDQYTLVPLRSEYKDDTPLELFLSVADVNEADEKHLSPATTVIRVLEHYRKHPQIQPVGHRISVDTLDTLYYWLREDRKQLRQLNMLWKRRFPKQPCPAGSSLVMHEEYRIRTDKQWNEETGRTEVKEMAELVGYRLIIGVLTRTQVPSHLIVEPRRTKPVFPAPVRPIRPIRTPNYVPNCVA